jgi:gamma-glutamyltranspeptidase/glutathione hydrolase
VAGAIAASKDKLSPSAKKIWYKGDKPLAMGDRVVQKDLAATLREIGAKGSAAFYQGTVAEKFAAYMKANGGLIDQKDLAGIRANEDQPIHINYKGIEVYECPPNSQGFVMLQALNILEGMNVRYMRHNSAPYLHAVTESLKLAFADRNKYVGDPKFVPNIPMREMLSKEYAAARRALIDPDHAIDGEAPAGNPRQPTSNSAPPLVYAAPQVPDMSVVRAAAEDGHTTYLAVIDKDRNMVSVTSSLLSLFGSGHVVEGAGFMLNNRMAYYGLDESDPNVLRPGKRVRQTINPAMALKDGKPFMAFGTPGADTQPQAQMQFFLNVVEFGMNVQQALEASSIVSTGFKSSYYPHAAEGKLQVPASLPKHVLDELAAMGHKLDLRNVRGVGSVKAILVHPSTGVLMGGVSPSRDSYVMAY